MVNPFIKSLNDAIMPIGAKMYQQAAEEQKSGDAVGGDDKKKSKKDDEAVEGEVIDEK